MTRELLLERLGALDPLTSQACFVLLWTYLDGGRLASGENFSRAQGLAPSQIRPFSAPGATGEARLARAISVLGGREGGAFDYQAIAWLKGLDQVLRNRPLDPFGQARLQGLDGLSYRLRRRNAFLAEKLGGRLTWEKDQSGSRDLYTPYHVTVPETCDGRRIELRREAEWATPNVRRRLAREKDQLAILLWPLGTVLEYDDRSKDPQFVRLHDVHNQEALHRELRESLEAACAACATILVLPELTLSPLSLSVLQGLLARRAPDSHPLLVVAGLCHAPTPDGRSDVNEAVILGPSGKELHRHRKLSSFTFFAPDRKSSCGERLEVGSTVTVLESVVGNLCPLICLDLIHGPLAQVLRRSHANLLLVPSLSPSTEPHRTAAKQFMASQQAGTFVCNRTLQGTAQEAPSFFQVPRKQGYLAHDPTQGPSLLFELRKYLDRAIERQV